MTNQNVRVKTAIVTCLIKHHKSY